MNKPTVLSFVRAVGHVWIGVALCLLVASNVFANTVTPRPSGGGQWHNGVYPNEKPRDAFWDNSSRDGSGCNVGYWLGGSDTWGDLLANCDNDGGISAYGSSFTGPGPLDFYADINSARRPVGWDFVASGDNAIQMAVEVAGWRSSNILGYYTLDSGTRVYDASNVIFDGSVTPNQPAATKTLSLNAGVEFGCFLCSNVSPVGDCDRSSMLFNANSYANPFGTPTAGKFALFSEIPTDPGPGSQILKYWVGVEDIAGLDFVERKGDFNDLIFSATVHTVHVPEPGLFSLLAVNLLGLLIAVRFFYSRRRPVG